MVPPTISSGALDDPHLGKGWIQRPLKLGSFGPFPLFSEARRWTSPDTDLRKKKWMEGETFPLNGDG